MTIEEQLSYLKKGSVDCISTEDLKRKLERAEKTGKMLRVKAQPLHFEKKRKNNKWPIPHKISCNGKLTYFQISGNLHGSETEKKLHKTQVDGSIHAVSIDPGVRTPFTWYSPTKGVGKIGEHDIGRIVRLCTYMDKLISQESKFNRSTSKRKKNKAKRLNKAVACMRRKNFHLQNEIQFHPPFEVSNMTNRKSRKIT